MRSKAKRSLESSILAAVEVEVAETAEVARVTAEVVAENARANSMPSPRKAKLFVECELERFTSRSVLFHAVFVL